MKPKGMKCSGVLCMLLAACVASAAEPKPNILWITGEDMSAQWLGCYGNRQIKTPNFDQFAKERFLYWGVIGCIQLGKQAATPEVLKIREKFIKTDVKDERTLDVRVTPALYLCQTEHQKDEALRSFAEGITTASQGSAAKGRAWANVFLLGSDAKGIAGMLKSVKLNKKDQETLSLFQSRLK